MSSHPGLSIEEIIFNITEEEIQGCSGAGNEDIILGQPRAQKALELGTSIKARGYNIFVTGPPGTGRYKAIRKILERHTNTPFPSKDIVYVNNFTNPESPMVLYFLPGDARKFRETLHGALNDLYSQISEKLDSHGYKTIKAGIVGTLQEEEDGVLQEFELRLTRKGFHGVYDTKEGRTYARDFSYLLNGEARTITELSEAVARGELDEEKFRLIKNDYYTLKEEFQKILRSLLGKKTITQNELNTLRVITITPEINTEFAGLRSRFPDPRVQAYLDGLENDIMENLDSFLEQPFRELKPEHRLRERYDINILEDRTGQKSPPVIFENHPSYVHLFGAVDLRRKETGEITSNFRNIRGGSILKASGGFLVIQAETLLADIKVWNFLKQTLKSGRLSIMPLGSRGSDIPQVYSPEEIEIDVKVILVGNENLFDFLLHQDPDFYSYFKIPAEFDDTIPREPEIVGQYIRHMENYCEEQGLLPLSPSGKAELIRYSCRLAEDRTKLTARLNSLEDILVEADYWAHLAGSPEIDGGTIYKAQEEKLYLNNLPETKLNELIAIGDINIPVRGAAVGTVNALAIQDRGFLCFGTPCLISSQTSPGDSGIINIEGEAGLSGEIHDKWIMILEGYLRHNYAMRFPLSLHCTICFEQSYGEVDGDSAAAAELLAILSSIAQVELRQDLAITGSLSQSGLIQAVGSVSEKVEGFFDICGAGGLTGSQGVLIPRQNVKNLILSRKVEKAIEDRLFHIYPIGSINQAIEILTGMTAGDRDSLGNYPHGTFNFLVEKQLKILHTRSKPPSEQD